MTITHSLITNTMKAEGGDSWGSEYSWTVDKTACLRNIRPGFGARQRFNTTILETCGAAKSNILLRTFLAIFLVKALIQLFFSVIIAFIIIDKTFTLRFQKA